MKLIAWLLTFLFAFSLGAGTRDADRPSDSELAQKVQAHMDVIVDESAAMVDDVVEEIRKDEHVQNAEAFVEDVGEIIDNTREDIQDHFGKKDGETQEAAEEARPEAQAPAEAEAEAEAEPEAPAEAEPEAPAEGSGN